MDYDKHTNLYLPLCKNATERKCFTDAKRLAKEDDIIRKPCTKLQYGVTLSTWDVLPNIVYYHFSFADPRVIVKEEYLIYDLLAVVSSIGGVMGLCIGFSFANTTTTCLGWANNLYQSLKRYAGDYGKEGSTFLKTENFQRNFQPSYGDLVDNISKLESQIVKHEMRIIALERKQ